MSKECQVKTVIFLFSGKLFSKHRKYLRFCSIRNLDKRASYRGRSVSLGGGKFSTDVLNLSSKVA